MSDDQWFLTEGNGSLTVRIREGLKVGEQASGFLALDDSRRINQWFRFYFNEQHELWMACLHGFVMQAGDSAELRRFKVISDTKVKLLSNEINVCKDPFSIDKRAQLVVVKPLFNSYVQETSEQLEATLPPSPIVREIAAEVDTTELMGESANERLQSEVVNIGKNTLTATATVTGRETGTIGSRTALGADGYADLNEIEEAGAMPTQANATGEQEADDLLDTVRIPAISADDLQAQDDGEGRRPRAATEPESDFYISSLWAEHSAGDKAGVGEKHRGRMSRRRTSTSQRQGLWKPRIFYLGAGLVSGCLLSALIFNLLPFKDDGAGATGSAYFAGKTPEKALDSTIASRQSESVLLSNVTENAANSPSTGSATTTENREESQLTNGVPDGGSEDAPHDVTATSGLSSDTIAEDALEAAVSGKTEYLDSGEQVNRIEQVELPATAGISNTLASQESDDFKGVLARQDLLVDSAEPSRQADKANSKIDSNESIVVQNSSVDDQAGFDEDWRIIRARASFKNGEIISPPGKNAVAYLQSYLEDFPESRAAIELLNQCALELTRIAEELYQQGEAFEARNTLEEVLVFEPENEKANSLWVAWHGSSVN